MTSYRSLNRSLHGYADAAQDYFSKHWGISNTKFVIEEKIAGNLPYKPTIHANTQDHHILCIDVVQKLLTKSLNEFILGCQSGGLPVKLFVAVPPDSKSLVKELSSAKNLGIGVIGMTEQPSIIRNALSLSLTGVRRPVHSDYPIKYRPVVETAVNAFLDGNPSKACLELYSSIEEMTRQIGARAEVKSCWKDLPASKTTPGLKWEKEPWGRVMDALFKYIDVKKLGCGSLSSALLGRTAGVVPYRNDDAHQPKSMKRLIERDAALRTRFEHAADLLRDLAKATKPLHL